MKARFRDVPYEQLPHEVHGGEHWEHYRGRPIRIQPMPIATDEEVLNRRCDGPFFLTAPEYICTSGGLFCTCIHLIELEADAEAIEQAVAEVGVA